MDLRVGETKTVHIETDPTPGIPLASVPAWSAQGGVEITVSPDGMVASVTGVAPGPADLNASASPAIGFPDLTATLHIDINVIATGIRIVEG